jgi:CRISPR/Cas system CSM-associated protein Csm5 (group 7 of RAMP superfamily)
VYQLKGGVKLATISMYQVCNKAAKGITSVYSQQNAWLRKHGRTEDPRKALHIDIKEAIQELKNENILIIIGGDYNDGNKSQGLHYTLSIKLGLEDAWGSQPAPSTHIRGTECIDHVYLSPDLHKCIQTADYLPFPKAYSTDHRPIKSLCHPHLEAINLRKKKVNSNDSSNVKTYLTERFKFYKYYKIQEKMEKLIYNSATYWKTGITKELLIKRMNQGDKALTLISLQAEQSIRSCPTVYSSPTINTLKEKLSEV